MFTLVLFILALAYSAYDFFKPKSSCEQLSSSLSQGYFIQWMGDQLLLVTSDKQQYQVTADDQQLACDALLKELKKGLEDGY